MGQGDENPIIAAALARGALEFGDGRGMGSNSSMLAVHRCGLNDAMIASHDCGSNSDSIWNNHAYWTRIERVNQEQALEVQG